MKKVIYVLIAVVVVIGAYIGVFNYLKKEQIKILDDKKGYVVKNYDSYLHYKVFNNKLLKNYGIDLRMIITDDNNIVDLDKKFQEMVSRHRKKAKSFVLVLVNFKNKNIKTRMSDTLKGIYNEDFLKNIDIDNSNKAKTTIKIMEIFLERVIVANR